MNEQPIKIIPSATLDKRYVTRNFLGSNENLKGASLVGIEDASGNFTGTTVEDALVELANKATTPPVTLHTQLSGLNDDADNVHVTSSEKASISSAVQKAGDTMTGELVLKTGSTTVAPLKMVAGTNLTTAVAGTLEFDGINLYFTV